MNQQEFDIKTEGKTPTTVSDFRFAPIKGQPMLQWRGKRPFTSTSYFPAQEKEQHGEEVEGWLNKIFNPHANRRTELARYATYCADIPANLALQHQLPDEIPVGTHGNVIRRPEAWK